MNIVFFGTPTFALPALYALNLSRHKILAVVSQPDRAKDRKGGLLPTPVKAAAEKLGLNVLQFDSVKKDGVEPLKKLNADIFVTAAYGQILSQEVLDIPKFGVINIHASLLPLYRGSSPVHHAILNGDKTAGLTIMQTRLALDSGEIILQESTTIDDDENAAELTQRLSVMGADLLLNTLDQIERGTAVFTPQDEKEATYCGKITGFMSVIDWCESAEKINNQIRALGGSAGISGRLVKITKAAVINEYLPHFSDINNTKEQVDLACHCKLGEILPGCRLIIKCGKGALEILVLTPAGGKSMTGEDFMRGLK
ncbi:MAG: methionyl-tRNA formyltransferase [Firmicutes bacterium]|nr:methionyl-tRNA formyltransferase [Bacillota bacterium]